MDCSYGVTLVVYCADLTLTRTDAGPLNERMTYLTVEAAQPISAPSTKASASFLSSTLLIPLPSCKTAAELLIRAFGGPEEARKVVGGVEWWDVRALDGVAAEWMVECATQADRREKESDGQPILLYLHGVSKASAGASEFMLVQSGLSSSGRLLW